MRFDDHFIQQVRSSIDIVSVVSGYVNLKKQGTNHSGLCPFHGEKTPSFKVNQSMQIFKCFGCGQGGDVFRFIELMEGLSFPEAVRQLAERQGIPLPASDPAQEKRADRKQQLLKLMDAACRFFQENLQAPGGRGPRAYLERRGITADTIEAFWLGFAPRGSRLLEQVKELGFDPEDALTCGLLVRNDRGELYDKFRERVMFPIRDLTGRVIAFGGRALSESGPKYLNSPETPLYHKGNHLYSLDLARDAIRKQKFAILVEGYFDCIVPYQFGFKNVVASLGTSLTDNQVKMLGRYTQKIVINFDPDEAGVAAAVRSIDLFGRAGMQVNVVELPDGADPDSFLRQEGAESYRRRLRDSSPYLEFLLNKFSREHDLSTPRGKQAVVDQIVPYLSQIPNRIERVEYASRVAHRLRIEESLLLQEIGRTARTPKRHRSLPLEAVGRTRLSQPTLAEKRLLQAALQPETSVDLIPRLSSDLFQGLVTEHIFAKLLQLWKLQDEISVPYLRDQIEDDFERDLLESAALPAEDQLLTEELIEESVRALRLKQQQAASHRLQRAIAEAEASGDQQQLDRLLQQKAELRRRMELDLH